MMVVVIMMVMIIGHDGDEGDDGIADDNMVLILVGICITYNVFLFFFSIPTHHTRNTKTIH